MKFLVGASQFSTKKRSSESSWQAASMLVIVVAVASALAAHELILINTNKAVFFQLRATNLEDLRTEPWQKEAFVDASTPVLHVEKDKIIYGTLTAIASPRAGHLPVLLDRDTGHLWIKSLARIIRDADENLPSKAVKVLGLSVGNLTDIQEGLLVVKEVGEAIRDANIKIASRGSETFTGLPSPIFVELPEVSQAKGL